MKTNNFPGDLPDGKGISRKVPVMLHQWRFFQILIILFLDTSIL